MLDGTSGLLAWKGKVDHPEVRLREALTMGDRWLAMPTRGGRHVEAKFDAPTQGKRLAGHYKRVTGLNVEDRA